MFRGRLTTGSHSAACWCWPTRLKTSVQTTTPQSQLSLSLSLPLFPLFLFLFLSPFFFLFLYPSLFLHLFQGRFSVLFDQVTITKSDEKLSTADFDRFMSQRAPAAAKTAWSRLRSRTSTKTHHTFWYHAAFWQVDYVSAHRRQYHHNC